MCFEKKTAASFISEPGGGMGDTGTLPDTTEMG